MAENMMTFSFKVHFLDIYVNSYTVNMTVYIYYMSLTITLYA